MHTFFSSVQEKYAKEGRCSLWGDFDILAANEGYSRQGLETNGVPPVSRIRHASDRYKRAHVPKSRQAKEPLPRLILSAHYLFYTMAPPVAVGSESQDSPILMLKRDAQNNHGTQYDVSEDYNGHYRFAPIEEAQVSRAMIKR